MESRINAIAKKMNDLVNKEDVEAITVEMTKLMNDAKITKGRLADLEDDIDNILERQERAEGRLEQLELFKQIAAEMQAKLKADISASQKDKELMENRINAIAKKINDLVNKEDVEAITVEMTKLMNDAKITKGRLADLEDDIDSLINAQENGQTLEVYALNEIVYDNLLLNHMYLLKEVGKYIRMCDAIGLSGSLSQELVSEAIHNQDQDLVWAGILSLTGRQTE
jgi:predicted  nucleic acid-binding Zn-ribbon protein